MADSEANHAPRTRRRVLARLCIVAIVASAVVGALLVYKRRTDPEQVRAQAQAYLQQFVNGRVSVGSAQFSWLHGIRLYDVTVSEAARDTAPGSVPESVFSCRETRLAYDPVATLFGKLRIETITAIEPTCVIVHDAATGTTNLAGLWRGVERLTPLEKPVLPTIDLRAARVRVVHRERNHDRVVEDLALTIRSRHSTGDPRFYDVVWHGGSGRDASGHSRIDLQTGSIRNVRGGLPWMSIEAVLIAVGSQYSAAGTWGDLLGIEGAVRAIDYGFGADSGRSARIGLKNASLSIPINEAEQPLPPDERYLQFEQVYGSVELTANGISAQFDASFHGASCRASATMRGGVTGLTSLDDVDFEVDLSVKSLRLPRRGADAPPEEARFVQRWPKLDKFFRTYDPHGLVDVEISGEKHAGADAQLKVKRMLVTARGGDALCRFFPYRLSNLAGQVEMLPSGIYVRGMRGEHDGGLVTVGGWVSAPKHNSAVELAISGAGIPVDRQLYEALSEKYRRFADLFAAQGRIDVELKLSRPESDTKEPAPWQSRTAVSFDDLAATYVKFPYPLKHLSGLLVIDRQGLEAIGIKGQAGQAKVGIDGKVEWNEGAPPDLALDLYGAGVEFNETLFAALPAETRRRVAVFHPEGRFGFDLALRRGAPAAGLTYELNVVPDGAAIKHDAFPITIREVEGNLRITPDHVAVRGVKGRYRDATLTADGDIEGRIGDHITDLAIHCRNLPIDEALRDAAPERLRKVLSQWRVDDPIEVAVTLRTPANRPGTRPAVSSTARLANATVRNALFPASFRHVSGKITVDESGVTARGLEARYNEAEVHVDFDTVETRTGEKGTISLTATGLRLDDSIRELLPSKMRSTWDRIGAVGEVDLRLDQLRYRPRGEGQTPEWYMEGQVGLHDIALLGTAELREVSGTASVAGLLVDRAGGATLQGDLELETSRVLGQPLVDLKAPWTYAETDELGGVLAIGPIHGGIHGGSLTGELELVSRDSRTEYRLKAAVHGMDIQPYLIAASEGESADAEPLEAQGIADARFDLAGLLSDTSTRRGSGRVEIREGRMYRLPIMVAILNVINLAVPEMNAFHNVQADFRVAGNSVLFRNLLLRGNALALTGYGSMSLPDYAVNLFLVNVSPHSWARLPGIGDFIESASRSLVELHVTGPVSHPSVHARPLRSVTDEVKRLFKKKKRKTIVTAGT